MSVDGAARPIEILLVEDSRGDVRLIAEALKTAEVAHELHVAVDGEQAMAFLRDEGEFAGTPRPDIVILDLNLPKKNGRSVLHDIKHDEEFRRIPVIVLTTSSDEDDIRECYNLHANCYITKPMGMDRFNDLVKEINEYWFSTVRLPPG